MEDLKASYFNFATKKNPIKFSLSKLKLPFSVDGKTKFSILPVTIHKYINIYNIKITSNQIIYQLNETIYKYIYKI